MSKIVCPWCGISDDVTLAAKAERDALRVALVSAGESIGGLGDDLTYIQPAIKFNLHVRAYDIMKEIDAALAEVTK